MSDGYLANVLSLVKARLNRLAADASLDEYFRARIGGAWDELAANGITLDETSSADLLLLVDFVVWQYGNRDKAEEIPAWLRERRKNRWLSNPFGGMTGGGICG